MATTTTTPKDFADLSDGFGIVTVMNAHIFELQDATYTGQDKPLTKANFKDTGLFLDTLKIANLTMEGPTKTVTGGQYSNPLIKYGKTMTMEAQDALGRFEVLERFFGCDWDKTNNIISVTDRFPGAFAIEGDTFFIDQASGEQVDVHIFIPQFIPDGILNLTQDAEGDATVFDLNGSVSVTRIAETADEADKGSKVFYQIRKERFCTLQKSE